MVDLLSMFRRRPAKRGKAGFARSRDDITALSDSFGNMLTGPVRDAPPIAREASLPGLDPPRVEKPRPRPKPAKQAKPAKTPAKSNGAGAPQLGNAPLLLVVAHDYEAPVLRIARRRQVKLVRFCGILPR